MRRSCIVVLQWIHEYPLAATPGLQPLRGTLHTGRRRLLSVQPIPTTTTTTTTIEPRERLPSKLRTLKRLTRISTTRQKLDLPSSIKAEFWRSLRCGLDLVPKVVVRVDVLAAGRADGVPLPAAAVESFERRSSCLDEVIDPTCDGTGEGEHVLTPRRCRRSAIRP